MNKLFKKILRIT